MNPLDPGRVAVILGAEGKHASHAEIHRLLHQCARRKLKRPLWRSRTDCGGRWRDSHDWLRSLGRCPGCQHDAELAAELLAGGASLEQLLQLQEHWRTQRRQDCAASAKRTGLQP